MFAVAAWLPMAHALTFTAAETRNQEVFRLYGAGDYQRALPLAEDALRLAEAELGPNDPDTLTAVNNLAQIYLETNHYQEAEALYLRALESRERVLGPDHPDTLVSVNNLAGYYYRTGRYAEAEPLYRRALQTQERVLGPDHPDTILSLANLGKLYEDTGRINEAESSYRRSLEVRQRVLGPDNQETLASMNNLAALYDRTGRTNEAEALYRRALEAGERTLGPDHPLTLFEVNNLGVLYRSVGRYADAEPLLRRASETRERVLGPDHPDTVSSEDSLAQLYDQTGRHAEAESLYRRALDTRTRVLGPNHPDTLMSAHDLAASYFSAGRYADAEPLYERVLAASGRVLGPDHPRTLLSKYVLALLYYSMRRYDEAEPIFRSTTEAWRSRFRRGATSAIDHDSIWYASLNRFWQLTLAARLGENASREALSSAVVGAQFARAASAGTALQAAAARFASGNDRVAERIRARDAASARLATLEGQQTQAFAQNRYADATALAALIESGRLEVNNAAELIAQAFPQYSNLIATDFVDLEELQRGREGRGPLLDRDEALLIFVDPHESGITDAYLSSNDEARWLAVAVTRNRVVVKRLPDRPQEVTRLIAALRVEATPEGTHPDKAFDLNAAHRLYRDLIAPLEPDLIGVRRLLVVPDGPLQSLPLDLLVAQTGAGEAVARGGDPFADALAPPRAPEPSDDDDYRRAQWLGDRYEIAVLPSVSALRALRRHSGHSQGDRPLIAFADPALGGAQAQSSVLADLSGAAQALNDVCELPTVPATERIGESLRRALGAPPDALIVGADASQAEVMRLNDSHTLRRARVIAFNTHGLTAAEAGDANEPALALTPEGGCGRPFVERRDPTSDGLLTTSEIVGLDLDADWVLLTACNTAAPDSAANAEPLSGLARAFFYAGARALLVSHWPAIVSNEPNVQGPTELLIAQLFAPGRRSLSKAAALQRARQAVRQRFPHPAYWATFSLIGDGR